nr:Os12g0163050 [Ipomoea batatas]
MPNGRSENHAVFSASDVQKPLIFVRDSRLLVHSGDLRVVVLEPMELHDVIVIQNHVRPENALREIDRTAGRLDEAGGPGPPMVGVVPESVLQFLAVEAPELGPGQELLAAEISWPQGYGVEEPRPAPVCGRAFQRPSDDEEHLGHGVPLSNNVGSRCAQRRHQTLAYGVEQLVVHL